MNTFVKICGITDEIALRAAVYSGADALGFVFHEQSPRDVPVDVAMDLAAKVRDNLLIVAVTKHPDAAWWEIIQATLEPDVLQTDLDDFRYLQVDSGIRKWPVIREGNVPASLPEQFIYEGTKSGQGETVDWSIAANHSREGQMILAGGLTPANVASAVETVRPFGVDVSSGVESSPGIKDPDEIKAFIEAAKAA